MSPTLQVPLPHPPAIQTLNCNFEPVLGCSVLAGAGSTSVLGRSVPPHSDMNAVAIMPGSITSPTVGSRDIGVTMRKQRNRCLQRLLKITLVFRAVGLSSQFQYFSHFQAGPEMPRPGKGPQQTRVLMNETGHLLTHSGAVLGITHCHISVLVLKAGHSHASTSSSRPTVPFTIFPPKRTTAFPSPLREADTVIMLWRWKRRAAGGNGPVAN